MPGRLTAGTRSRARLPLEWGCAKRARPGVAACGDAAAVKAFPRGLLVGGIDGLGRGQEAAVAAESAVRVLQRFGRQPLEGLVNRCHRTLMMTRGAALSLAAFRLREDRSVHFAWLGVGNVDGLLVRADPHAHPAREHLPLAAGVVGYYLPRLHETARLFFPGDTLILRTDGIRGDFEPALDLDQPPAALAEAIVRDHFRGTDDALVLVVRFTEEAPEHEEEMALGKARSRRHQPVEAPEMGGRRQGRNPTLPLPPRSAGFQPALSQTSSLPALTRGPGARISGTLAGWKPAIRQTGCLRYPEAASAASEREP